MDRCRVKLSVQSVVGCYSYRLHRRLHHDVRILLLEMGINKTYNEALGSVQVRMMTD